MTLSVEIRHRFEGFSLDASFEAPAGLTVLFGRSGSGKSTVMNTVAGLLRPDQARIKVAGAVLADTSAGVWVPTHRRGLGMVFQDGRLFPHLTVRQNLAYGRWFAGGGQSDFDRIVEMLGIGALLSRRPGALSGGEKARVALGRALLAKPRLILADEPLAALDEARKAEILPYFKRLRDEGGVPILYVSHSPAEVARLATTVVALEAGRVLAAGPATQVLGDPGVTPLGPGAAGAVVTARVMAREADGLCRLEAGGLALLLPLGDCAVGSQVRVRIAASDVMLATEAPRAISALNVWPAVVTALREEAGPGALVQLRTGEAELLARVTRRSVAALGLAPGQAVFAVLKAVSVEPAGPDQPR